MLRIFIIRHGQTTWNVERKIMGHMDIPLDSIGAKQAWALEKTVHGLPLQKIFCSPQWRARQTAELITEKKTVPVEIVSDLAEVDYRKWVGRQYSEIPRPNDGSYESTKEVWCRTSKFLQKIAVDYKNGDFGFVSHGDPIRTLLSYALVQPIEEFERFRIYHASLTMISCKDKRWVLELHNFGREIELKEEL